MLLCIWNRRVLQQQRSFHSCYKDDDEYKCLKKKLSSKKKIYIVNLARNILYIWNRTPRIKSKTTHYHTFAIHLRFYNVWDQSFLTTWSNTSIIYKGIAFYSTMKWTQISFSIFFFWVLLRYILLDSFGIFWNNSIVQSGNLLHSSICLIKNPFVVHPTLNHMENKSCTFRLLHKSL